MCRLAVQMRAFHLIQFSACQRRCGKENGVLPLLVQRRLRRFDLLDQRA